MDGINLFPIKIFIHIPEEQLVLISIFMEITIVLVFGMISGNRILVLLILAQSYLGFSSLANQHSLYALLRMNNCILSPIKKTNQPDGLTRPVSRMWGTFSIARLQAEEKYLTKQIFPDHFIHLAKWGFPAVVEFKQDGFPVNPSVGFPCRV